MGMIEVGAVVGREGTVEGLRKGTEEGKTEKVEVVEEGEGEEKVVVAEEAVAEEAKVAVMGSPASQKGAESSMFRDLVRP